MGQNQAAALSSRLNGKTSWHRTRCRPSPARTGSRPRLRGGTTTAAWATRFRPSVSRIALLLTDQIDDESGCYEHC